MAAYTDKILELLSHVPDKEKHAEKRFFNTLLKVAIKRSGSCGYKGGTSEYVNSIYFAYLQTFYPTKRKKIDIVSAISARGCLIEAIDKNIFLVSAMDGESQNEAKDQWKSIAVLAMKNVGNGYKYGTAYHINHQVLNYLELYCGINMSKNITNVFRMSGSDMRIGA